MRILCVDDDAVNRQVIAGMLSVAGAEMADAEDAQQCLSMVDQQEFSAILMDLRMPGMDGIAAIQRLRARGDAKAALPIIVATADTGLHVREQCLAAGADEVLMKPIGMRKLFDAIGTAIGSRASVVIG